MLCPKSDKTRVDLSSSVFSDVPVIAARQDQGPPRGMLENLGTPLNLSEDQKTKLKSVPDRDID